MDFLRNVIFRYLKMTFHLMISEEGNKHITITDINGRIVKSFSTEEREISLLDLASGQYFITILTDKNELILTQKIVK